MINHLTQLAIHSYYVGEMAVGLRSCERLLRMDLNGDQENQTRTLRTWYTPKLTDWLDGQFHKIDISSRHNGWTLFNPSVLAVPDGWLVNVRSSNYLIRDWKYVTPPEDGGRIRTENIMASFSLDLGLKGSNPLITNYSRSGFWAEGMEDVRLNSIQGKMTTSSTLRDLASWDGSCRIATSSIEGAMITELSMLASPGTQAEKNWMPLLGRRQWLYSSFHEGHVALVHEENGNWVVEKKAKAPLLAKGFRGGSQLVPLSDGKWLAVVHEVAINGGHRVYEHRFVVYDEYAGWHISAVSQPFVLRKKFSIEFVAGLARHGDRLVISFGEMDEFAWLLEISLAQLMPLLGSPT